MKIVVWLTEGTWEACIDAVRDQPATSIELLHVIDLEVWTPWRGLGQACWAVALQPTLDRWPTISRRPSKLSSTPHRPVSAGRQADRHDGADQNERSSLLVQAPAC